MDHVFLSYSRKDNTTPVNAAGEGWVTAFARELVRRHAAYSGRELKVFFDKEAIVEGEDWRRRLGKGIRESRLFLAFLSPNYITSKNCLWEWDEYLRREHSHARGDDGITPIFFVTPRDLTAAQDQKLADWLKDLQRRNRTANCELQPWFDRGPEILKELDAAARSLEVKNAPRAPTDDPRTLAERLTALDIRIAARLDSIALADLAPGNISRSHEHFVGRHAELSALHTILTTGGEKSGGHGTGGYGMIAAAFSPGGLGKTALARQYAHAYAECFAAGGTWEVPCEGTTAIGAALLRLADSQNFRDLAVLDRDPATGASRLLAEPLALSDAQRSDFRLAAEAVLAYLKRVTFARVALVRRQLASHPERHTPTEALAPIENPRALLVLDNVDQPELLDAREIAQLLAEEWLELIVTTRLNPADFGGSDRTFHCVEVHVLPESDALHLLRDFQETHAFPNDAEDAAALEIVRALGGYTLAVELVAAYLGDRAKNGYLPSAFLADLQRQGLAWVDSFADKTFVDKELRHSEATDTAERKRQNRVGTLIGWSLARLSPPARTALEFASLLMPDAIPLAWLKMMTSARHPEVKSARLDEDHCWPAIWRELHGLRLLHPARPIELDENNVAQLPETVRLHRLVAEHIAAADAEPDRTWGELDQFLEALGRAFEGQVGQGQDAWLRAQHPWLRDQLEYLIAPPEKRIAPRPPTSSLLIQAQVVGDFEAQHGLLARGLDFFERILKAQQALPDSAEMQRSISTSLNILADFLARRGQPGDAEQALAHYQRSLEVSEKLLRDNPDSAQAARDVSVSLERLGDFLARRGQPGDAEQALAHYQRSLEVREKLLRDNPDSAAAQRDVLVSLERMAQAYGGRAGGQEEALALQVRSLELALKLRGQNPQSFFYQRTAAVAFFLTYQRAEAAGNEDLAVQCLTGCFSVLDPLVHAGVELDPGMRNLHAQLQPLFTKAE
jgi:tetratricopeptide (TPR) repeat protein